MKVETMWMYILEFLGLYEPIHCKAVRKVLSQENPSYRILGTETLKREADVWIVAVYYQEGEIVVKPPRYKVFSVSKDLSKINEFPSEPRFHYKMRGRK